ncbi:pantoate kinase [Halarchaeum rubridurum]|uniref:Pantoate kinase n=1 Tax=Halarchaeum rubridurum TaxID=489911 RepID=A0A830FZZ8_9EURY|nr:pantoate kinase [Halarchaeum rubridurum]MBP1955160.1 pantoate kinase [Halarchaeum rubridurum]GGM68461.1 sugar kinase [Halarchaeum rubridurum]
MTDEAAAFVPGHVTGFFSVHRAGTPTKTGSRGAGVTLADGVRVRVAPADERRVTLNGREADVPAVEHVLDALDATAAVSASTDLPVGAGFGVSGGMALGAALAANGAFEGRYSENELVRLAHEAEVTAGTGLGDVVAQARGGVPIRLDPGAPPHGQLDGVPATGRIEYVSLGELSTADVLAGSTARLSSAGVRALSALRERPTIAGFVQESRRFAEEADLLTPEVEDVVADVVDAGGEASMAMLGHTVFALGHGLSDAGYDATATRVHDAGASLTGE